MRQELRKKNKLTWEYNYLKSYLMHLKNSIFKIIFQNFADTEDREKVKIYS